MQAGLIGEGTVDGRSINDVDGRELADYRRVHLFAGIGGWEYALQLAGWPAEREVWTGSCPCQPFSSAGKQWGTADVRHLWPEMCRLIAECRPGTVIGEQVSSKLGREWIVGVQADLEALGYAVGVADLPACSVGAPHIRQRLFWVANAQVAQRRRAGGEENTGRRLAQVGGSGVDGMANAHCGGRGGNAISGEGPAGILEHHGSGDLDAWREYRTLDCWDQHKEPIRRRTPVEPAFQPLAPGVPGRVDQLRGLGNAIVPQVGAVFIRSFLEAEAMMEEGDNAREAIK